MIKDSSASRKPIRQTSPTSAPSGTNIPADAHDGMRILARAIANLHTKRTQRDIAVAHQNKSKYFTNEKPPANISDS